MSKRIVVLTIGAIPILNRAGPILSPLIVTDVVYNSLIERGVRVKLQGVQPDEDTVLPQEVTADLEAIIKNPLEGVPVPSADNEEQSNLNEEAPLPDEADIDDNMDDDSEKANEDGSDEEETYTIEEIKKMNKTQLTEVAANIEGIVINDTDTKQVILDKVLKALEQ